VWFPGATLSGLHVEPWASGGLFLDIYVESGHHIWAAMDGEWIGLGSVGGVRGVGFAGGGAFVAAVALVLLGRWRCEAICGSSRPHEKNRGNPPFSIGGGPGGEAEGGGGGGAGGKQFPSFSFFLFLFTFF